MFIFYPQDAQMSCTTNKNGTFIDCELGNPLQRDAEVSIGHHFYPHVYYHLNTLLWDSFVSFRLRFMWCLQHPESHSAQKTSTSPCNFKREWTCWEMWHQLLTSWLRMIMNKHKLLFNSRRTSVQTIQPVVALAKVVFELEVQVYGWVLYCN